MNDLISRQKTIEEVDKYFDGLPIQGHYDMVQIIKNMPTIDAAPVVRCKDCKYGDELCGSIICLYHNADGNYCEDGGFCAWGERRTDGND